MDLARKPETLDDLMARRMRRKCEDISAHAVKAFKDAAAQYGTLSAEDLLAIGTEILMQVTILPLERLSDKPLQMRNAMAKHFAKLIKLGSANED